MTQFGDVFSDADPLVLAPDGCIFAGARNGIYRIMPTGETELFAVDPNNLGKKYPTADLLANVDGLTIGPDEKFYGTTSTGIDTSSVATVDASGTPALYVALPFRPGGIRFAPVTDGWEFSWRLFVTDRTYGRVVVVTPQTMALSVFAEGLVYPADVDFDPVDASVFVADGGAGTVLWFKPNQDPVVIASGLSGPNNFSWGPQGRLLVSEATGFRIVALWRTPENQPPNADAGPSQVVEQTAPHGAFVILGGSNSTDPDSTAEVNDIVLYEWFIAGSLVATGTHATVLMPPGMTEITLRVTDSAGNTDEDTTVIVVVDTTPPSLSVQVQPGILWPPSHKLVPIVVQVFVSDVADPSPSVQLVSVASSEPDNGLGDSDTANDFVSTTATATVSVPHSIGK